MSIYRELGLIDGQQDDLRPGEKFGEFITPLFELSETATAGRLVGRIILSEMPESGADMSLAAGDQLHDFAMKFSETFEPPLEGLQKRQFHSGVSIAFTDIRDAERLSALRIGVNA